MKIKLSFTVLAAAIYLFSGTALCAEHIVDPNLLKKIPETERERFEKAVGEAIEAAKKAKSEKEQETKTEDVEQKMEFSKEVSAEMAKLPPEQKAIMEKQAAEAANAAAEAAKINSSDASSDWKKNVDPKLYDAGK